MAEGITLLEAWVNLHTKGPDAAQQRDVEKSLETFQRGLAGLITAATAAATAITVATTEMAKGLFTVYYEAQRIGSTVERVKAFGQAVEQAGGSGPAAISDLEKFSEKFRVNPAFRDAIKSLGHLSTEDMKDAQSAYIAYSKVLSEQRKADPLTYGKGLKFSGLDEGTVLAIGRPKFAEANKDALEFDKGLEKIAEKSVRLREDWIKVKQHLDTIFTLASGKWMDLESDMLERMDAFLEEHKELFTKISDAIVGIFLDDMGKFDDTAFGTRVHNAFWGWIHSIDFTKLKNAFIEFANWLTTGWLADKINTLFTSVGNFFAPGPGHGSQGRFSRSGSNVGRANNQGAASADKTPSGDTTPPPPAGKGGNPADFAEQLENLHDHDPAGHAKIMEFLRTGGHGMDPATTDWCASFVGSALHKAGYKDIPQVNGGDIANAYQNWGVGVAAKDVQRGDVVITTRRRGPGVQGGHISIATGPMSGGKIPVIEGDTRASDWAPGHPRHQVGRDWEEDRPGLMYRRGIPPSSEPAQKPESRLELHALRQQVAMLTNGRPLNTGNRQWTRHNDGAKTQDIRITINSTDPHSAAHETARQMAHLQNQTMRDWRNVEHNDIRPPSGSSRDEIKSFRYEKYGRRGI